MLYYLMYLTCAAATLFILGEMLQPDSFWMSVGRVYCTFVQSVWYFAAARILYEGEGDLEGGASVVCVGEVPIRGGGAHDIYVCVCMCVCA